MILLQGEPLWAPSKQVQFYYKHLQKSVGKLNIFAHQNEVVTTFKDYIIVKDSPGSCQGQYLFDLRLLSQDFLPEILCNQECKFAQFKAF